MKRVINITIFWILVIPVFSQPNVLDSFKIALIQNTADSVKIDKLNKYIIQFASIQPEIALLFADTAIELSGKMKDSNRLAYSLNRKGVALFYLGDYNASLENYFLAINIKEETGKNSDIWREYNNIGLVLRNLNQNEEALKYFKMALSLVLKTDNKKAEAILWNNIGISYRGLKKYWDAKNSLEKAYSINNAVGAKQSIALDLNNLGNIYKDLQEFKTAIDYYLKALEINNELFNKYEKVQNLNNLAEAFLSLKQYDKARPYLDHAAEILNGMRADQLKLNNLKTFSSYFAYIQKFEQAFIYKEQYVKMKDSIFFASRVKQFDQLKTLANTEKEIQKMEFLNKINFLQAGKIKNQKFIQLGSVLVILLILVILFILIRNLKIKKELNLFLTHRSMQLSNLNEELQSNNKELKNQHDELEITLQSLQSAQYQLIQSEKMASLGVLAAGVAHEIQNPLNFIQEGIEAIETYFIENLQNHSDEVNFMINGMQVGVGRASEIVTSLNHYSRQDDEKRLDCNLYEIIDNCLVMLNNYIKDRIEINKNYRIDKLILNGNESKLHQAMLNILANAVQSIDGSGTIGITSLLEKETISLIFEDSGCGIKQEDLPKIFDPFFTTKDPGKGTGLGLSITYNILKEHDGTIEIHSTPGIGTNVLINFPLNKAKSSI